MSPPPKLNRVPTQLQDCELSAIDSKTFTTGPLRAELRRSINFYESLAKIAYFAGKIEVPETNKNNLNA